MARQPSGQPETAPETRAAAPGGPVRRHFSHTYPSGLSLSESMAAVASTWKDSPSKGQAAWGRLSAVTIAPGCGAELPGVAGRRGQRLTGKGFRPTFLLEKLVWPEPQTLTEKEEAKLCGPPWLPA